MMAKFGSWGTPPRRHSKSLGARVSSAVVLTALSVDCVGSANEAPAAEHRKAPTADARVAPVPLRRLTREEYNNTVRDLLGDTTRPANAFPPDETVGGFESNSIAPATSLLVELYMDAAEGLASRARARLDAIAPCSAGKAHEECAAEFVERFGGRAFRRPLVDAERATLLSVYADKARETDHGAGIQLALEVILQSPQFLYRVEPIEGPAGTMRALTGNEIATRLAYFVWSSTPDDELLDAAADGLLSSPADVERAARRLLADPRAKDGVRNFHRQWLGLRELETESKDVVVSPTFTPALKDAMVEETLRFSTHAVFSEGDAVAALLTSKSSFVNAPLAKLYGVAPPAEDFALVDLPASQRSGVLTHASVLAVHATALETSPILRGKFVREKFLCQEIPPPPPSVNITPPSIDPTRTTKERFLQHRTDRSCSGCHELMDPIGFGFEHYDSIGAWRDVVGAFPVDSVGELSRAETADGRFDGAVELGARLASSDQVRHCFATQWFRFALGRGERDEDAASIEHAYGAFAKKGFDVRELIVAIAMSHAFLHVRFEEGSL